MGRTYTVAMSAVSAASAQDLWEINAAADSIVIIHEIHLTQDDNETSQQLPFSIHVGSDSGSGGTTPTPVSLEAGDAAFGGTVEMNNTTRATKGNTYIRQSENVLNGFHFVPVPESRIAVSPSGRLIVGMEANPTSALFLSGYVVFEEVGG